MKSMVLLALGVVALVLVPSGSVAQDATSDTVYTGTVFLLGNDIGRPPFVFRIVRDSLRIQSSESSYPDGYPIKPGMRRTQEIDYADRNPPPPDPLDTGAEAYEKELRQQPGMTQRKLIEAMAAYYRADASVDSVFVKEGDVEIGVFRKQFRGQGFPSYHGFSLIPPPRGAYPDGGSLYDPLRDQKNHLMRYAQALAQNRVLVIGDGGLEVTLDASFAPRIRDALRQGGPQAVAAMLAEDPARSSLTVKLFRNRLLPGLP